MHGVEAADPAGFLARSEAFLRGDEARHNLMLGLALARATSGRVEEGALFASVTDGSGRVVGCVMRTPPHKVLVTDLPTEATSPVVDRLTEWYDEIPAILGPPRTAEALARAWVARHGGVCRPGMLQGVYRLDDVTRPEGVRGAMRAGGPDDLDRVMEWGEGFGRDTGIPFPGGAEPVRHWLRTDALRLWEDEGEPVSVAVAHGRTGRSVRIGYVYTPPERRGRGYASALVAEVSQEMLDSGCAWCTLYTDLSNPTSNAIYRRIGYRLIEEVQDYDVEPAEDRPRRGR
jgi:ribosomal protein S18 acetylase RimI-like enzyme